VFYADDTPKTSLRVVTGAIGLLRSSGVGGCTTAAVMAFAVRSFATD
jgi:hypothetical protein